MRRPLPLKPCRACFRRAESHEGQICKQCFGEWFRIQKVRQAAMALYPKLQGASTARFIETLWKIHLQEKKR